MEESPHHFRVFRVALVGIQKSKHFQKQTDISPKVERITELALYSEKVSEIHQTLMMIKVLMQEIY